MHESVIYSFIHIHLEEYQSEHRHLPFPCDSCSAITALDSLSPVDSVSYQPLRWASVAIALWPAPHKQEELYPWPAPQINWLSGISLTLAFRESDLHFSSPESGVLRFTPLKCAKLQLANTRRTTHQFPLYLRTACKRKRFLLEPLMLFERFLRTQCLVKPFSYAGYNDKLSVLFTKVAPVGVLALSSHSK